MLQQGRVQKAVLQKAWQATKSSLPSLPPQFVLDTLQQLVGVAGAYTAEGMRGNRTSYQAKREGADPTVGGFRDRQAAALSWEKIGRR